METDGVLASKP